MKEPHKPREDAFENQGTNIPAKSKERLSDRELADLMGVNRQTHKRVRGAIRKR